MRNQEFVLKAKAFDSNMQVLSTKEVHRNANRLFLENLLETDCPSIDEAKNAVMDADDRAAYVMFTVTEKV